MKKLSYENLKNIKKGDILYECEAGSNIEFEVIEEPTEIYSDSLEQNQLKWVGKTEKGTVNFLITEKLAHYGPKIYRHPIYTTGDFNE